MKNFNEPLEQFIPEQICLSCDGCCRFYQRHSCFRARVLNEEKELLLQKQPCPKKTFDKNNFIQTRKASGHFICQFLNESDNHCKIYEDRPLECQLYPFMFIREKDSIFLCIHQNCLFVQGKITEQWFSKHIDYVKEYLLKMGIFEILKQNIAFIGDYHEFTDEFYILARLDLDNNCYVS